MGNLLLDELKKMNEQLAEVTAQLDKIEQNTKIGVVTA